METEEAENLVKKAMSVILSCKTQDQLHYAARYAGLAYDLLAKEGLINMTSITSFERCLGYAQCNIDQLKAGDTWGTYRTHQLEEA